jgi:predicted Zn-dependent protease
MPDRNAVIADDDLLDEQSRDALAFQHAQPLGLGAQALEEFTQRVSESQVGSARPKTPVFAAAHPADSAAIAQARRRVSDFLTHPTRPTGDSPHFGIVQARPGPLLSSQRQISRFAAA